MRITFVTPSLACGGAERCVTLLARGFLKEGHNVTVITVYSEDTDFYALPEGAQRIALGIEGNSATVIHGLFNNLRRIGILRRAIKSTRPDVVISHLYQTNIMTILAARQTPVPAIVVEHNDPGMNPAGKIWETLRRRHYPRASKLVSVSHGVDKQFSWLPAEQRTVIHNPLELMDEPARNESRTERNPGVSRITAMGRLTAQKGFDLLLPAFAKASAHHPNWRLMIIGEGRLRGELERLSEQLGVAQVVSFTGLLANPLPALRDSKLFAMASRFEGFPYAALEAMACGLPVIYTNCPSGPGEIIRDGVDGLLVPNGDVVALAGAMERLMSDETERDRLAARAPEVLERFGTDRIVAQWEELFKEL